MRNAAIALACAAALSGCSGTAFAAGELTDIQGRLILAASDADMLASAYIDGNLGPDEGRDALSIIRLGGEPRNFKAASIEASNAVTGPPAVLAVTPDGRFAIVIETLKQKQPGDTRLSQLQQGSTITVVDLVDSEKPVVVQKVEAPGSPGSVSINADGSLIAITILPGTVGTDRPLLLYPFKNGRLGEVIRPVLAGWVPTDRLMDASFHPQKNILVMLNWSQDQLQFVELKGNGADLSAGNWGDAVRIDRGAYIARFTPNGRYVITSATYGSIRAPLGSLISVGVDLGRDATGKPRHAMVSRAQTGVLPEGLAISPDGKWIVTTNLERTPVPFDNPLLTPFASLSLVRLDPETGILSKVGDFPFEGILPESAVFDNSSRFIAVATFDHFEESRKGSSIDFWRIATDPVDPGRTMLVKTDYSVNVRRGAHTLAIVR